MLQLQTQILDICRISKLLVKYNINASISNQVITLDGDISDELLSKLCNDLKVCAVRNFKDETFIKVYPKTIISKNDTILSQESKDTSTPKEVMKAPNSLSHSLKEYDLIYSKVKRGEVYLCDYGEPYGSEQGHERYAIVVQNDDGNLHSPTTIVLACTTEQKKQLPVHYNFTFSPQNMVDYNSSRVSIEKNIVMAEQIRTVDKTRLRKFLGTMNSEFMDKMQNIIDISLHLNRQTKTIVKQEQVYVEKPIFKEVSVDNNEPRERRDINMVQVQLLSLVDMKELLKIFQSYASDEIKTEKILKLFGFDFQKNGVQYLLEAILISPKNSYFNLETLSKSISNNKREIEKEEIKRLIVARVKEQFKFKKSPTIDFIRLVNCFLIKEDKHEEINI